MNGLLRRLTRRRAATADESPPRTPVASEPVDATVVSHEEGPALSEEERKGGYWRSGSSGDVCRRDGAAGELYLGG